MGIEDEEDLSEGYGYEQQQNYSVAQQNYTTHQPSHYTMAQQSYNVAQQTGYDDSNYYASNDDSNYYASNDRRYVGAMPSSYHHQQQQYRTNNRRVVKPVAAYAQLASGWGWGGSSSSRQYFGQRALKYSDPGYDVHQNSSGYQSEWMYS